MHFLVTTLIFCIALLISPANAGPGHEHEHGHSHGPISEHSAIDKANKRLAKLVETNKVDTSWSNVEPHSIEQKSFAKGPEWVISFQNPQLEDTSKQTLFLFFSLDGHYIGANYTGQ